MKIRKLTDKKPKIVIFQGSPRDEDSCPGMSSKSRMIVDYIIENWSPFVDFDEIDLSVNLEKNPIIQPCKGCVSTAGGFHCHWKCDCYAKGSRKNKDLLKELNVYDLLEKCDAFIIISPIHWHALSSQVKLLFDRLVCANLTLTVDNAKKLMGEGNTKDPKVTGKYSKSGKYDDMLQNHLEGKYCAFYAHGDDGSNEYLNRDYPDSYSDVISDGFSNDVKSTIMPYVMQMKYSGVYVPDDIIQAFYINKDIDYYSANLKSKYEGEFFERADSLMENLLAHIDKSTNI